MNPDQLRAYLTERQVAFAEDAIQHGRQFRCAAGEIFNLFDTGRVSIQGRRTELSGAVEALADQPLATGNAEGVQAAGRDARTGP